MISLGIDCGTQSTKCLALDVDSGRVLASSQQSYDLIPGLPSGAMEQNPADWVAACDACIKEVVYSLGQERRRVVGLGVSGQQHGLVPLDADYRVVRPAKLWCDTSTSAECAQITGQMGGDQAVIEACGNAMLPGYTLPKILWLKNHEPENFRKTRWFLLPHDYLNFWLTGKLSMEYGDASGTALLNVHSRQWSQPLASCVEADLLEKFPELHSSCQSVGPLKSDLARDWGLEENLLVSAGGGDNMMGAIGTGNVSSGLVTASLGTSGTLYAFSDVPVIDPAGEVAAFCDSTDHWLPLVCTMNVTLVTESFRKLGGWSHEEMDGAVSSVSPGSDGLLLLPYWAGERTPNLPNASGVLHGMNSVNFTDRHLARAAMEGVTLGLAHGMFRLRELGVEPAEIRLTGGGSKSRVWRQICADSFGVPVITLQSGEGAALGAAIQAAWNWLDQSGKNSSLVDLTERVVVVDETSRAEPGKEACQVYGGLLQKAGALRSCLQRNEFL
jgi:xylulokinase